MLRLTLPLRDPPSLDTNDCTVFHHYATAASTDRTLLVMRFVLGFIIRSGTVPESARIHHGTVARPGDCAVAQLSSAHSYKIANAMASIVHMFRPLDVYVDEVSDEVTVSNVFTGFTLLACPDRILDS